MEAAEFDRAARQLLAPGRGATPRRAAQAIARGLLKSEHRLLVVGSVRTKHVPRDLDLVMVLPDGEFERIFGPIATWAAESASGQWTAIRFTWSDVCVALSRLLAGRIASHRLVDCKVIPEGMPDYGRRPAKRRRESPSDGGSCAGSDGTRGA